MFAAGALSLIFGWSMTDHGGKYIIMALLLGSMAVPCIMSYVWWRQKAEKSD